MNTEKKTETKGGYPVRLDVDYPETLDRFSTFFRLIMIIPIAIILSLLTGSGESVVKTVYVDQAMNVVRTTRDTAGGIAAGIPTAVALMILFKQVYPRWWFDFLTQLAMFETRVGAYALLLTDQYPSTVDEQSVHLEFDYPDVEQDLSRWLAIFKWFLAIPHYLVLAFLMLGAFFAVIGAWFAILITGQYPETLFNFVVGVMRWGARVRGYAFMGITDQYPPFSLE